jgi:hypothetical protein
MLGGGVPKNFAQDIVVAAELLNERKGGKARGDIGMHKYAIQMTVADSRDGALSGSTLREACSWGKVDVVHEQMVFGDSALFPILASDAYHRGSVEEAARASSSPTSLRRATAYVVPSGVMSITVWMAALKRTDVTPSVTQPPSPPSSCPEMMDPSAPAFLARGLRTSGGIGSHELPDSALQRTA